MNPQLQKFAEMPWKNILGIALICCAAYYFLMFDNGASLDAQLQSTQTELETNRKTLKETQDKMKDLEKFREQLSDQEAQVAEVLQFLPKDLDVIGLSKMIQDSAKQAGLAIRETKPEAQVSRKDFYEMQKISITMQGTYVQISRFLSQLSKLPRLVTVEKLKLAVKDVSKDPNPKLDVEAVLVGYRIVEDQAAAQPGVPDGQ